MMSPAWWATFGPFAPLVLQQGFGLDGVLLQVRAASA